MHLPNNTLLQGGKYKIVRFISSGGFGCTYEAEHILLKKRVAIKEFFVKDFCNRDETTSQISVGITSKTALVSKLKSKFIAEAQSLCSLEHPNIVHVFDVFEENGTAYYVMDYIDGPSLNDMVKKDGPMSEQKAVGYIMQVADALKYVHSQNRLHLDIKPGNIMVDENDKAVLIDFGASKQYDEEGGENTSTLLGKTPGYAPLEQMGNDVVKFLPSTDIYALGATLYKLLTGNTPPSASLLASGETLDAMPSFISEGTRNAIIQSMQTNKMKRPQSMDEFQKLLDNSDSTIIDTLPPTPHSFKDRRESPYANSEETFINSSDCSSNTATNDSQQKIGNSNTGTPEDVNNTSIGKTLYKVSNDAIYTYNELSEDINKGGRFVEFSYIISFIWFTWKNYSKIYYIASNETAFANGWIYGLISLLLGWWGIWGLFYTPVSIWKAFKGVDVTDMVMGRMQEHYHSSNGVFSIEKNELCGCIFPKISQ